MCSLLIPPVFSYSRNVGNDALQEFSPEINPMIELEKQLYRDCTEVFTGEVISLNSEWDNSSKIHTIYTYAEIKVTNSDKSTSNKPIVTIVYEGGFIGNHGLIVETNPWGTLACEIGQTVIVYGVKDKQFKQAIQAINIDIVSDPRRLGSKSRSLFNIYEEQGTKFEYAGQKWDDGDLPIEYYVNPTNEDSLDENDVEDAMVNAFETWEAYSKSDIDYSYQDPTETQEEGEDGENVVFMAEDHMNPNWGAVTYLYITSGKIVEFDICLNDDYDWTIGRLSGHLDVETTVLHEAGHTLRLNDLDDPANSDEVMWGEYRMSGELTSLEDGDKTGAQFIYPSDSKPSVSISFPGSSTPKNSAVYVIATVTGATTVQFKAADYFGFDYDTGWITMTGNGDTYSGIWNTPSTSDWYYVTVRATSSNGIYNYDARWFVPKFISNKPP